LFRPIPWRRRGVWSAALAGGFLVLKLAVDLAVQNPVPLFSPTVQPPDGGSCRLGQNLRLLLSSPLAHPIWLNAGTLAALALIPSRIRLVSLTRTVAVCFALSIFVFGVVSEYRIWFEMAPLAVVALSRWLSPADVARELQQ